MSENGVTLNDQIRDYQFRGESLALLNLYEFLVNTYEIRLMDDQEESREDERSRHGRPRKERVRYLPGHGCLKKARIERSPGHETVLRFVGRWIPRNNDPSGNNELYSAVILFLLKPWRALPDLGNGYPTFQQALSDFLSSTTSAQKTLIENIQYYHDCWDNAQKRRDALRKGHVSRLFDYERDVSAAFQDTFDEANWEKESGEVEEDMMSMEAAQDIECPPRNERDIRFANEAMLLARAADIFRGNLNGPINTTAFHAPRANADDMIIFDKWEATLKELTRSQWAEEGHENLTRIPQFLNRSIEPRIRCEAVVTDGHVNKDNSIHITSCGPSSRPILSKLNQDQRRAHDIVEEQIFGGGKLTLIKMTLHLIDNP